MPHFFIDEKSIKDGIITISDKENYNHIVRSHHAKIGEKLLLIDNQGVQYETAITEISSKYLNAKIKKSYKSKRILPVNLYLAQSVVKKEAQTQIIQKAAELGVKGLLPFISDNCVIKKSYVTEKLDKYGKISQEASKQCERPDFMRIFEPADLKSLLKSKDFDIKIACVEKYSQSSLKKALKSAKIKPDSKILVIIGCEGGFSEDEFKLFQEYNIPTVSLGNLVLRADTAAITALSNIIYELCDE